MHAAMLNTALSLMMLTIIALVLGAIYLIRKGGMTKQALLMLFLAMVLGVNIGIWTLPDDKGQQKEMIGRGRYLDRWSFNAGVWAIDHREHVLDMHTLHDLHKGAISAQSTRDINDASFRFIRKFQAVVHPGGTSQ